ncbi:MAG: phosphoribosyl-AMP cyclohydrolase [Chloroflexi bacterium]|nr:phosphoribosyl-AMP cyclohydrolase [Chloroflexota bacterium]
MKSINDVVWDPAGLAPVIVQDAGSGAVLALAKMDRPGLAVTLATGRPAYWKAEGEHTAGCAGHTLQMITAVRLACDGRAILLRVQSAGPVCRTGSPTCFEETLTAEIATRRRRDASRLAQDAVVQWSAEAAEGA